MSGFLLDTYPAASTIYALFHTYDSSGASVTLSGLAAADIEIFKNGSVTQRNADDGYALLDTDGIDFDGRTGIHGVSIDLNDNTDAGFYAAGSQYTVVIDAVTVDLQTVRFVLGSFRIVATEHTAGYPVATIKDGTGTGEIDTTSGGVLVAAIAANAITAASIATNAIGADELADGAITAATFAAGAIDATAIANSAIDAATFAAGAIDAAAIADGAIDAATFAAGAITAAAIANGAIDAATFAADVDAEILSYIVDDATRIDASALNTAAVTSVPAILADTGTDGVVVASINNNVITAASINADAITDAKVASDVTIASVTGAVGSVTGAVGSVTGAVGSVTGAVGSVTGNVGGNVTGSVGSIATGGIAAASFAAGAIDATAIAADAIGSSELAASAATEIADAILTRQITEAYAANGVAPTTAQALMAIHQALMQFAIASTTKTVKKLDNSTTAFLITHDSDSAPTSAART